MDIGVIATALNYRGTKNEKARLRDLIIENSCGLISLEDVIQLDVHYTAVQKWIRDLQRTSNVLKVIL
jgi:hypothetical protein